MTSKDKEANGAKVDNSHHEAINITSSSKTYPNLEAGVSNDQILGQDHFANQEMDAELNAHSAQRQQQALHDESESLPINSYYGAKHEFENEDQNSQLKEVSN